MVLLIFKVVLSNKGPFIKILEEVEPFPESATLHCYCPESELVKKKKDLLMLKNPFALYSVVICSYKCW